MVSQIVGLHLPGSEDQVPSSPTSCTKPVEILSRMSKSYRLCDKENSCVKTERLQAMVERSTLVTTATQSLHGLLVKC